MTSPIRSSVTADPDEADLVHLATVVGRLAPRVAKIAAVTSEIDGATP